MTRSPAPRRMIPEWPPVERGYRELSGASRADLRDAGGAIS